MTTYNIHEAKTRLSELLRRVLNGEEIIIAKSGRPIAILKPFEEPPERREPGSDGGLVAIHADFDLPLPEFDL